GVRAGGAADDGSVAAVRPVRGAAAVGADPVGGAGHAHPLGGAGLPVVDEHVGRPVGVPGHEVRGARGERDEAAVGAEREVEVRSPGPWNPFSWFPALSTLTRSVVPAAALAGTARRARTPVSRPTAAILLAAF